MPAPCLASPVHLILDLPHYPWRRNVVFDFSWTSNTESILSTFIYEVLLPSVFAFSRKPKERNNVSLKQRITNSNVYRSQNLNPNRCNAMKSNGDWLIGDHPMPNQVQPMTGN